MTAPYVCVRYARTAVSGTEINSADAQGSQVNLLLFPTVPLILPTVDSQVKHKVSLVALCFARQRWSCGTCFQFIVWFPPSLQQNSFRKCSTEAHAKISTTQVFVSQDLHFQVGRRPNGGISVRQTRRGLNRSCW